MAKVKRHGTKNSKKQGPFIKFYLQLLKTMRGKPVNKVAKIAGTRWRAMSVTQRLCYYPKCGTGRNWTAAGLNNKRNRLSMKVPNVSRSPFINFFVHFYQQCGSHRTVSTVARIAGIRWRSMGLDQKRPYYEASCRYNPQSNNRHACQCH